MKQVAFISGKGGTGKTVLSGALSAIPKKQVIADCDVDAANLHLLLHPALLERHAFTGGNKAVIDPGACLACGICRDECPYDAITPDFRVNTLRCNGCGLCSHLCPVKAIRMEPQHAGEWYRSETKYGPFVHARLGVGEANSGKLVYHIKQVAKRIGREQGVDYLLVDGPPGIGCPLIATIAGADLAVIVTEPTLSAIHDLERVVAVTGHFRVKTGVVINKYDLNPDHARYIESACEDHGMAMIGKLPFSEAVEQSVLQGVPVIECPRNSIARIIKDIWRAITILSQR